MVLGVVAKALHGRRGNARILLRVTSLRVSGLTSHLLQQIGFELLVGYFLGGGIQNRRQLLLVEQRFGCWTALELTIIDE